MDHPQPTVTKGTDWRDYETHLGWPDKPYSVQVNAHNLIYISVKGKDGFRQLNAGQRGYIYTTENPRRVDRLIRKCLRIAWRLNHDPEYAADTKTIVALTVAKFGTKTPVDQVI